MSATVRSGLLLLVTISAAFAQVASSTISGTVHDSSGAIIPNANVTITQTATSEVRTVTTNGSGEFNAPNLPIGPYSVTVKLQGFKTAVFNDIVLQVDKVVNLPIVLQPGVVSESVEVTGGAPLVDTVTSSLGQVIDNKKINDLPLNSRNVWALGLLSGNAVPVKGVNTNLPFTAGGGRYQSNDILLDGIDNNTIATGGSIGYNGINYSPSVDAVAEFKVKTNNYSAEFGRSAGTIVSAITKSGTNQLNGDVWEFVRNNVFDANNFFSNASGKPRQPFKQNQFGFTLGGPIVLPKIYNGHNRTFFLYRLRGYSPPDIGVVHRHRHPSGGVSHGGFFRLPISDFRSDAAAFQCERSGGEQPVPGQYHSDYSAQRRRPGDVGAPSASKLWRARRAGGELSVHGQPSRLTATSSTSEAINKFRRRTASSCAVRAPFRQARTLAVLAGFWAAALIALITQRTSS